MVAQYPIVQHFEFNELLPGLVICEASRDIHGWDNATANTPAFLLYLGYNLPAERHEWITKLRLIWKIEGEILDRPSQRVKGHWHELKIRVMSRQQKTFRSRSKDLKLTQLFSNLVSKLRSVASVHSKGR